MPKETARSAGRARAGVPIPVSSRRTPGSHPSKAGSGARHGPPARSLLEVKLQSAAAAGPPDGTLLARRAAQPRRVVDRSPICGRPPSTQRLLLPPSITKQATSATSEAGPQRRAEVQLRQLHAQTRGCCGPRPPSPRSDGPAGVPSVPVEERGGPPPIAAAHGAWGC